MTKPRRSRQLVPKPADGTNSPRYGTRFVAWQYLDHAWLGRFTSWSVIAIEVSCPLFLLIGGWPLVAWAVCAAAMHLSVAVLMGLGRFTWSFGAGLVCLLAVRLGI